MLYKDEIRLLTEKDLKDLATIEDKVVKDVVLMEIIFLADNYFSLVRDNPDDEPTELVGKSIIRVEDRIRRRLSVSELNRARGLFLSIVSGFHPYERDNA